MTVWCNVVWDSMHSMSVWCARSGVVWWGIVCIVCLSGGPGLVYCGGG